MSGASRHLKEIERFLALAGLVRPHKGDHHPAAKGKEDGETPGCSVRPLPERLAAEAAGVAAAVNPVNAPPNLSGLAASAPSISFLTASVGKYLGAQPRTLTVSFMETTPVPLRNRIIEHLNAWNVCCGIQFRHTTGTGQVRISRTGRGYWSYLGTDVLLIPRDRPTMNLQSFTMATSESEYRRVVRHEAGHTLGFEHEHMRKELVDRIDPTKAYAYFLRTQGWDKAMVDAQVLTPLSQSSIMGTPADATSIMCYQLPGSIMKNGIGIAGGTDINATDCAYAGQIYPRGGRATGGGAGPSAAPAASVTASRPGADPVADRGAAYDDIPADWPRGEDVDAAAAIEEFLSESGPAR